MARKAQRVGPCWHGLPPFETPTAWPGAVKMGLVQAAALAQFALVRVRGWAADSPLARVRLAAKVERLEAEVALLREEIRIKDASLAQVAPSRRPHYPPNE